MADRPEAKKNRVRLARQEVLQLGLAILVSAASGVLLLLAFPPFGLWPLIWIGFVPYLFAQYRLMPHR